MKILYCNPTFWDYRIPFYKKLIQFFQGDFYVMYSSKRYKLIHREQLLDKIKNTLGDNAIPFENEIVYDVKMRSFKKIIEGSKHIPFPLGLFSHIRKIKPDVLITEGFFQWTPIVLLYSILFRKPLFIGYERTSWTERHTSKLVTFQRKITDKFVTGYLVNGSETKKYLESIGVASDKIHIGGMSADSEGLRKAIAAFPKEERDAFRMRFMRKQNGLVFLFSGRVEELKGAPHLLEAWKEHIKIYPNDSIILIGMGDAYDILKHEFESYNSVFLQGRIEYNQVYKYYSIADVFILPTLQDNWSLVIPEAMACGLPVATSIYNGCYSELIKRNENGCVFDPLDKKSLLMALDYFHHVDLQVHGKRSIEIEKSFSTEACAKREFEAITNSIGDVNEGFNIPFHGKIK